MEKNYYEILGIDACASLDDIREAFRALAKKYHPDAGTEANEEMFQEISEAYEILGNDAERSRYDLKIGLSAERKSKISLEKKQQEKLEEVRASDALWSKNKGPVKQAGKNRTTSSKGLFGTAEASTSNGLFDRLKSSVMTAKGEDDSKGKFGSNEIRGERIFQFSVDALESLKGTSRELAVPGPGDEPRMIKVNIPAGVCHGDILEIETGEGEERVKAKVIITSHDFISRDGLNVILKVPVTIGEALNGSELEVPSLDGPIKVKLPPQKEALKKLRIKGKGARTAGKTEAGDLIVEPQMVLPDRVSESVKMAASAMDDAYLRNPRSTLPKRF